MRESMRALRHGVVGVVAVVTLAAPTVGCSDDDGERATPDQRAEATTPEQLLTEAADRSAAETYRMTTTYSMDENEPREVLTGATDGRSTQMTLTMESVVEDGRFHTMELVGDETTQYVRTTVFHVDEYGELPGATRPLQELGPEWGRVDIPRLEGLEGIPAATYTRETLGPPIPGPLFSLVSNLTHVENLGREEVRGEAMTGLSAEVSMIELYPFRGMRPLVPPDEYTAAAHLMVPVEVWVDDAGFIRRFSYELSTAEMNQVLDVEHPTIVYRYRLDIDDYGADDIRIETPAGAEEAPDMTDAYAALLERL